MIKKIILFILIIIGFSSCKKERLHKVTYEIEFINTNVTGAGYSNDIVINAAPCYPDNKPKWDRFNLPSVWGYDYFGLKDNDKVYFSVFGQSHEYNMRVYIDGVEISYLHVISVGIGYSQTVIDRSGRPNDSEFSFEYTDNSGVIVFRYHE